MRSTLIAVFTSFVLALSAVLIAPTDVESKGKWPMSWEGKQKSFVSKPFIVGNRPGTDLQHQLGAIAVRKKPGRTRCVARFEYFQVGNAGTYDGRVETRSRRVEVTPLVWEWDMTEAPKKVAMRVRVKTNGNCIWALVLMGPRKGPAPGQ